MAASTETTLIPTNTSAAAFRAWGQRISTALGASGWVQTADTGQINWTTVSNPVANNTSQGYEVWRMNDALQATFPVYMKIEYGSGPNSGGGQIGIALWITLGNGSNGSGTITNPNTRQIISATSVDTVATGYSSLFSGTAGRFTCCMFNHATIANKGFLFFIERSKDATGADTGTWVQISAMYNDSANSNLFYFQIGQPSSNVWRTPVLFGGGGAPSGNICYPEGVSTTGTIGADVAVYTWMLSDGGIYLNAPISLLALILGDFTALSPITVIMYGTSRTFMPLGRVAPYNTLGTRYTGAGSTMSAAMLYE